MSKSSFSSTSKIRRGITSRKSNYSPLKETFDPSDRMMIKSNRGKRRTGTRKKQAKTTSRPSLVKRKIKQKGKMKKHLSKFRISTIKRKRRSIAAKYSRISSKSSPKSSRRSRQSLSSSTPSTIYQSPVMKVKTMTKTSKRRGRGRRSLSTGSIKMKMTTAKSKRPSRKQPSRRSLSSKISMSKRRSQSKALIRKNRVGFKYFLSPKVMKMMKEFEPPSPSSLSKSSSISGRKGKGRRSGGGMLNSSNSFLLYKLPPEERQQLFEMADELINDSFIDDNSDIDQLFSELNAALPKVFGHRARSNTVSGSNVSIGDQQQQQLNDSRIKTKKKSSSQSSIKNIGK